MHARDVDDDDDDARTMRDDEALTQRRRSMSMCSIAATPPGRRARFGSCAPTCDGVTTTHRGATGATTWTIAPTRVTVDIAF